MYHVSRRLEQFVICHLGSQSLDLIAFQGGGIRRMDPMKTTPSQRLGEKNIILGVGGACKMGQKSEKQPIRKR
jgi:hypothetical protein